MRHNKPAASELAHDNNLVRVAAEISNMLLNPLHSNPLILKTKVQKSSLLHLFRRREAKGVKAVVSQHANNKLVKFNQGPHQTANIIVQHGTADSIRLASSGERAANLIPTTMDPYYYGQLVSLSGVDGCLHVNEQAVFASSLSDSVKDRIGQGTDYGANYGTGLSQD